MIQNNDENDVDALVVGAGAVGLACGYALAKRGLSVILLEREASIGAGVSSRNSEVVHAGLYYPTGSLRARLCVQGRRLLYDFLESHAVAHKKCGKLIVACEAHELDGLEALYVRGGANDVEGLSRLTGDQAKTLEPQLNAIAAILSSESGVMDAHGYMLALQGEIEARGGAIALNTPFISATRTSGAWNVEAGGAAPTMIRTRALVIAAGLGAQACARAVDGFPTERIPPQHFGKGNYFALQGLRAPFAHLIYPMPIAGALGTHYRRDLGGVARFGPDLQWVEREDYHVDPKRAASFYAAVRRFWPALPDEALVPDYAGIRPKIHGPGEPQPDFVIDDLSAYGLVGLVCLFGIESPGLTSSLAIGEETARRLGA